MAIRIKKRTLLIGGLMTLLFFGLITRIYWVQVGPVAAMWSERAQALWSTKETIPQERGQILDRDGKVLAADAAAYTVAVGPQRIADLEKENPDWRIADRIVSKLHNVLGTSEADLRNMITAKKSDGTYLAQKEIRPDGWKVDAAVKDRLAKFREELKELTNKKDVGLYFVEEQKRYYPNGTLAAHILGYLNKDGEAVIGLEKDLDDELRGSPGFIRYEKDNTGAQLPNGQVSMQPAVDGKDVTLTIDRDIQFYIEQALSKAYEQYHPISITAIAADPKTMDILGMSSYPTFNPNEYWKYADNPAAFKDDAIQSVYEPGSTFKIVTLAAAVQEGLFDPDETYKSGSIRVPGQTIHDHNRSGWGEITFLEGLKRSSNVAFVKLGYEKLGAEKLRQYIYDFGFGAKTGIGLPGEVAGSIRFRYPAEVASATFGQGLVQVTPIQQVTAVAAVANGGKLMKPRLIESISDPSGGTKQVFEPQAVRQVISADSARKVGEYLETVVSDQKIGTGKNAYIPGYRIAGKTGTAQKVIDGKYSDDKYVVSFIGYAPVDDPKIVLYVIVDEPQVPLAGGGSVAAPIFRDIMEQSLRHLGVYPNLAEVQAGDHAKNSLAASSSQPEDVTAAVPDVTGMALAQAKNELSRRSFDVQIIGKGSKVLQQLPKGGSMLPTSQPVYLLTDAKPGTVPDMTGLSLRDAISMCTLLKISCKVQGEGYVTSQSVQPAASGGAATVQLVLAPPDRKKDEAEPPAKESGAETPTG
jgi:penicillin-binding protein 2B